MSFAKNFANTPVSNPCKPSRSSTWTVKPCGPELTCRQQGRSRPSTTASGRTSSTGSGRRPRPAERKRLQRQQLHRHPSRLLLRRAELRGRHLAEGAGTRTQTRRSAPPTGPTRQTTRRRTRTSTRPVTAASEVTFPETAKARPEVAREASPTVTVTL